MVDDFLSSGSNLNLSIRLIEAFLTLARTKQFSIAAEQFNVTASAFSQMIARLEEVVGARLFERSTRSVELTREGEVFARGAHRITAEVRATLRQVREIAGSEPRIVAIAAPPAFCGAWLPKQMEAIKKKHPSLLFRLHDAFSNDCLAMVRNASVDFGLNSVAGDANEYDATLLVNERMYVICPADDKLAANSSIELKELAGREITHMLPSGSMWQRIHPWLAEVGAIENGIHVTHMGTLAGLVASGFGIGVIPATAASLSVRPGVKIIRIRDPKAFRPIYLIKRKNSPLSAGAQLVWNQLLAAATNEITMESLDLPDPPAAAESAEDHPQGPPGGAGARRARREAGR
ncbi:LysR family transcriptional regulator [Verticiella sediminum]|nr:LysR family transcriptional regulator [Verticiella sediminum]